VASRVRSVATDALPSSAAARTHARPDHLVIGDDVIE